MLWEITKNAFAALKHIWTHEWEDYLKCVSTTSCMQMLALTLYSVRTKMYLKLSNEKTFQIILLTGRCRVVICVCLQWCQGRRWLLHISLVQVQAVEETVSTEQAVAPSTDACRNTGTFIHSTWMRTPLAWSQAVCGQAVDVDQAGPGFIQSGMLKLSISDSLFNVLTSKALKGGEGSWHFCNLWRCAFCKVTIFN